MVTVTKYGRLSRSPKGFVAIVAAIQAKGAGFLSPAEDIATTTLATRLVLQIFASIVRFEREWLSESTRAGWVAAWRVGRVGGTLPAHSRQWGEDVCRLRDKEGRRISEIDRLIAVSPD